jgi:hypothetical protein
MIYIYHQISLRTGETLKGKHQYERFAKERGVKVKGYHADNHPFGSAEFRADIENQDQELTFSGTDAHHQNGVAERAIRTVTSWARAMLLHSVINWPEQTNLALWPFAMHESGRIFVESHA